jgi:hypothetical protein
MVVSLLLVERLLLETENGGRSYMIGSVVVYQVLV